MRKRPVQRLLDENQPARTRRLGAALVLLGLLCSAGNCSRARVESMKHMNEGVTLAQQKRYEEAIKSLEKATALDRTNEQAFYNLALLHIDMQNFNRAKEDLQTAISIRGGVAGYHEKLGTVLMALEQWDAAKASFGEAIKLDPDLFKSYYKLAQVHEELDDAQNALHQYTKAIERGPRFLEAYAQLGRLYANLGYLEQAKKVLESALLVAHPGSDERAEVHQLLGTVFQQKGDFAEAIKQFQSALEITPGMSEALFSLGWTYALKNDREEAKRFLQRYLEVATGNAPEHYVKAARDRLAELEQETI